MDTEYGRQYRYLYEHHWWWRARERVILDVLRPLRPKRGWSRILDVGCGDGLFFDRLAELGTVVEGVEPAAELVSAEAARRGRITIAPFDAAFQPSAPYGLILMLDVVEHLDRPDDALRHALDILEPDGVILVTVPAFRALWTGHDDLNHHRTRYTKSSFRALAEQSGLAIDRAEYFFHWPVLGKLAQRLRERVQPDAAMAPPGVPPGPINAALFWLSRAERALVGGLGLPMGTSLMVVGGRGPHPETRARIDRR
jgi:2-polyprenyl-3-methyl-5-hydroxy-6-metoxy-1,4-benzoquinol methylase